MNFATLKTALSSPFLPVKTFSCVAFLKMVEGQYIFFHFRTDKYGLMTPSIRLNSSDFLSSAFRFLI